MPVELSFTLQKKNFALPEELLLWCSGEDGLPGAFMTRISIRITFKALLLFVIYLQRRPLCTLSSYQSSHFGQVDQAPLTPSFVLLDGTVPGSSWVSRPLCQRYHFSVS